MTTWNQLKYRFELLNIAERLIVINVLCFVFPFLLNTIFFYSSFPLKVLWRGFS